MRFAILGATSQIAKDLILSFANADPDQDLYLFARRPAAVSAWLSLVGLSKRYPVVDFPYFDNEIYDAVINFIGVSDPAQAAKMGSAIFDLTLKYDEMVLQYLSQHSACRYLFLSSGAVYGDVFRDPVRNDTRAVVAVNNLTQREWYGIAKLHAEYRHRSLYAVPIFDIRVFSYFSRTQDLSRSFLLSDIVRNIRDGTVLKTTQDHIVRDFLHPADFYQLVRCLLRESAVNVSVDCYSLAPIDKASLLDEMRRRFGLRYEVDEAISVANDPLAKSQYYSMNRRAAQFGYAPTRTSLQCIIEETEAILADCSGNTTEK